MEVLRLYGREPVARILLDVDVVLAPNFAVGKMRL